MLEKQNWGKEWIGSFFADNLNIDMLARGLELGLIDCNFALLCFVLLVDNS